MVHYFFISPDIGQIEGYIKKRKRVGIERKKTRENARKGCTIKLVNRPSL